MKNLITLFLISILPLSCVEIKKPYEAMAPGMYRGKLILSENPYQYFDEDATRKRRVAQFPDISENEVVFNFSIEYYEDDKLKVTFYNAEERIEITDVSYGTERSTAHDTVRINFPEYRSYIYAEYAEDKMQGFYGRLDNPDYRIPFTADYGKEYRFLQNPQKSEIDVNGDWNVIFTDDEGKEMRAQGQFGQKGNQLTGTFATEYGDYRFLEGIIDGNKLWLSGFDGTHIYLFGGKMMAGDSIVGFFKSGKSSHKTWTAHRSKQFELVDPFSMTKDMKKNPDFYRSFPLANGGSFSLNEGGFMGVPKVIEIMGTWCPNCKDAGKFLSEYAKNHPNSPVKILGLAFERGNNQKESLNRLSQYRDRLSYTFPIALGGPLDKETPTSLPWIDRIRSYPTLVFFDHANNVQYVYTGFYGPATKQYEEFKKQFDDIINKLTEKYESK